MKPVAEFVVAVVHFIDAVAKLGLALVMLAVVLTLATCAVRIGFGI